MLLAINMILGIRLFKSYIKRKKVCVILHMRSPKYMLILVFIRMMVNERIQGKYNFVHWNKQDDETIDVVLFLCYSFWLLYMWNTNISTVAEYVIKIRPNDVSPNQYYTIFIKTFNFLHSLEISEYCIVTKL